MKAGIVLDAWKLPIFERRLKDAGFTWHNAGNFTNDTIALTVETDNVESLATVIRAANGEASRSTPNA
jgi:hypothetical protein